MRIGELARRQAYPRRLCGTTNNWAWWSPRAVATATGDYDENDVRVVIEIPRSSHSPPRRDLLIRKLDNSAGRTFAKEPSDD